MPSSTDRRGYIRTILADLFGQVEGIRSFLEVKNESAELPRGSYRTGATSFSKTRRNELEEGQLIVLVKIEFEVKEGDPLDDLVGALEKQVERAIRKYRLPKPYEDDVYIVTITRIDRSDMLPSLVREKNVGNLIVPVTVYFTQYWK